MYTKLLTDTTFGNPHSRNPASQRSSQAMLQARYATILPHAFCYSKWQSLQTNPYLFEVVQCDDAIKTKLCPCALIYQGRTAPFFAFNRAPFLRQILVNCESAPSRLHLLIMLKVTTANRHIIMFKGHLPLRHITFLRVIFLFAASHV